MGTELELGEICIVTGGDYANLIVRIIDLPDKWDKRYSVSGEGVSCLRLLRGSLEPTGEKDTTGLYIYQREV